MESPEKQTPRSSNAFKNKPGRGRTASHVKRSNDRTSRSMASRRTSVDSRKKSNPKCSRGKAYAKVITMFKYSVMYTLQSPSNYNQLSQYVFCLLEHLMELSE